MRADALLTRAPPTWVMDLMSLEDPAWTLNECRRVRHRSLGTSQQLVADQWNGPRAGLLARVGIALEVVVAEAI